MPWASEYTGLSVALAAFGCAIAVAACGSSNKPATTASSDGYASFLKFSECMRASGVGNFPDPSTRGGGIKIAVTPGTASFQSAPAYKSARQSCKHLLPGGGPPATVPESVKVQEVKRAECMRAHGVPNYPDPTFPKGGGVDNLIPSSINVNSPAFQRAANACGGG